MNVEAQSLLDVSANNILINARDKSVWKKVQQAEKEKPVPRKVLSDREVYLS